MTRLRTSRPSSSVPKRWWRDGADDAGKLWASGFAGAMRGAKSAITIQANAITVPTIASGCRHAAGIRDERARARSAYATELT
jgi:hypothetical protein